MNRKNIYIILSVGFFLALAAVLALVFLPKLKKTKEEVVQKIPPISKISTGDRNKEEVKKFASKEEMLDYLKKADKTLGSFNEAEIFSTGMENTLDSSAAGMPERMAATVLESGLYKSADAPTPSRISETNVQVLGIDEPDIVKTDGKNIYFSSQDQWKYRDFSAGSAEPFVMEELPRPERSIYPTPPADYKKPETKIISAFPPDGLAKIGSLEKIGNLLLVKEKKLLVIISSSGIFAYDISDPKSPKEKWTSKLEDKTTLIDSRLHEGKIYLMARNYVDRNDPCPIKPLSVGAKTISIACEEIYHPTRIIPADVTFSVIKLDAENGELKEKTSFIGSSYQSQVYMSENSIYVAYTFMEDLFGFVAEAISQTCKDILPDATIEHLKKIKDYDISDQAKMTEMGKILEDFSRTLSNDEEMRIENEIANRLGNYFKERARDLEKTGIVKIDADNLKTVASGNVPGHLLNQFSLDEYKDNLRVATSIGGIFWQWGGGAEANVNDVYVLNDKLEIIGAIKGLGVTERIYSARFLGNRGYLVTFRQIDPFYVLDLSNPKKPEMKGELKIPGYSSYLHPLADDIILGVGQEEGKVKLSLFDVKNASDPREIDKYLLSEYWSEAQNNHRAFLQDSRHEVFFLPGGKGGYVFSYAGNKCSLKKTVGGYQVKRAVYIDDYLYIIGEDKISVLNEKNWEKIKELDI